MIEKRNSKERINSKRRQKHVLKIQFTHVTGIKKIWRIVNRLLVKEKGTRENSLVKYAWTYTCKKSTSKWSTSNYSFDTAFLLQRNQFNWESLSSAGNTAISVLTATNIPLYNKCCQHSGGFELNWPFCTCTTPLTPFTAFHVCTTVALSLRILSHITPSVFQTVTLLVDISLDTVN